MPTLDVSFDLPAEHSAGQRQVGRCSDLDVRRGRGHDDDLQVGTLEQQLCARGGRPAVHHLVTQADIVGKIAGVTRLPAGVVGAIDLQLHHSLVDVATPHAELIVAKLAGIRLKGRVLCPAVAPTQADLGAG